MTRRSQRDGLNGTRKAEKALRLARTVSGAGPSLLESLEALLTRRMKKYYEIKMSPEDTPDYAIELYQMYGEVIGISRCIAKIRLPYENQTATTKRVFVEFLRKVKNNG
jgi:hypothetical protein